MLLDAAPRRPPSGVGGSGVKLNELGAVPKPVTSD
jgi:hypothetical protein